MRAPYIESKIEYTFIEKLRLRFQTVFIILCGKTRKNLFVRWSINFHIEKKTFHVLPSNRTKFQKVTQRSLRTFYVHLMFTKKRKSTYKIFVSAWHSMWTSQGLNLGPPDYESVALTNWATSPVSDEGVTKSSAKLVYYFGFSKFWGVFVLWRLFWWSIFVVFCGLCFCEMFCCGCFELFGIESLCNLL